MTFNHFLEAIAVKLITLWPERHVFVNEIPNGADGNFFIGIVEAVQKKGLDRRRKRTIQFEICYFLASKDNMEFNAWAETMFDEFEYISIEESKGVQRMVRLSNVSVRKDEDNRVFQFLFDVDFYFVITPQVQPTMYYLDQNNTIRSEVLT